MTRQDPTDHGTLIAADTIRFERLLPGPIERVWAYLTDSDKRALWLAEGPTPLAVGGDVALHFHNAALSEGDDRAPEKYREYENSGSMFGRITRCEPPFRLAYTWTDLPGDIDEEDSEVSFELASEGDRVRLALVHRRLQPHELLSVAGGWHAHLGILEDRLANRPPRPFWRTHTRLEAEYAERLGIE
ncbi:MAG: SRPBCC family protein [Pseudomonadota bacterium]